jgi:hypothetical protein
MIIETNYQERMTNTPLDAFFGFQRTAIRQTGAVTEELLRFPAEFGSLAGMNPGLGLSEQALELSRQSAHRSLDAAESVVGGDIDQMRDIVDEGFDSVQAQQDSLFGGAAETDPAVSGVQQQVDLLLELNEAIETQVQTFLDGSLTAENLPTRLDSVFAQFEDQLEDLDADPVSIEIDADDVA